VDSVEAVEAEVKRATLAAVMATCRGIALRVRSAITVARSVI